MTELENILGADLVERLSQFLPQTRDARWRYFNVGRTINQPAKRGYPMFAWSTERAEGLFQSWVWQPDRHGWRVTKVRNHKKRKDAKARALRMRNAYAAK